MRFKNFVRASNHVVCVGRAPAAGSHAGGAVDRTVFYFAMGNRNLRVNELLKREISLWVHRHLQEEAIAVTISDVESSADYRHATVFFSLLDAAAGPEMEKLLNQHAQQINQHLRRTITLRNIPRIRFRHDTSLERGVRVLGILDELAAKDKPPEA